MEMLYYRNSISINWNYPIIYFSHTSLDITPYIICLLPFFPISCFIYYGSFQLMLSSISFESSVFDSLIINWILL